jgi:hypothetical protein
MILGCAQRFHVMITASGEKAQTGVPNWIAIGDTNEESVSSGKGIGHRLQMR